MNKLEILLQYKNKKINFSNNSNNNKLEYLLSANDYKPKIDEALNLVEQANIYLNLWNENECKEAVYKAKDILEKLYTKNCKDEKFFTAYEDVLSFIGDYKNALLVYEKGLSLYPSNFKMNDSKNKIQNIFNSEV